MKLFQLLRKDKKNKTQNMVQLTLKPINILWFLNLKHIKNNVGFPYLFYLIHIDTCILKIR